jgi:hypothetical protein
VPRALTGIATAFPQLHPVLCFHLFLLHYRHRLRVLGNSHFNFISIGHIIASETEEDIFRTLGTSLHYIHIFLMIWRIESERRACMPVVSIGGAGADA